MVQLQANHFVFLVGMLTYGAVRVIYQYRCAAKKNILPHIFIDQVLALGIWFSQGVVPLMNYFFPTWFDPFNYPPWPGSIWLGSLTLAGCIALFWKAHHDLKLNWSMLVTLNQDHQLVTHGVYRYIRHPMYAAFFLQGISQVLLIPNMITGWVSLVASLSLYWYRSTHEERMMLTHFGDVYAKYKQRTGGIFPLCTKTTSD